MRDVLAVLAGAVVGTALRMATDAALPSPWSTLAVNVVGSFALAVLVARVWPRASSWLRAGLGTGMLGSFTTFSAFAVALVELGPTPAGLGYGALTVVLGLAAALAGLALGRGRAETAS
jgi:CrcB protein